MFIVSLEYMKDLAAVETYLSEHIAYLERYYQEGVFVMSGRKQPRTGGVILMKASGREQVEKLIVEDTEKASRNTRLPSLFRLRSPKDLKTIWKLSEPIF